MRFWKQRGVSLLGILLPVCLSGLYGGVLEMKNQGDQVYIVETAPDQIHTFSMATGTFGTPVALSETPTAFHVDEDGLLIGYDRRVEHRALDGSSPAHVANTTGDILNLYTTATHLYIDSNLSNDQSVVKSFTKGDFDYVALRTFIGTKRNQQRAMVSRGRELVLGLNDGFSPKTVWQMALHPDGTLGDRVEAAGYTGPHLDPRHVLHPDGNRFVGPDGMIYSFETATRVGSLHGEILDVVFPASGGAVVLRSGGQLFAYDDQNLETGRFSLSSPAERIFLSGDQLFAFRLESEGNPAVEQVGLSEFALPEPPAPPQSYGLEMTVDQVELDPVTGTAFVLDTDQRVVLRRNLNTDTWEAPVTLSRVPRRMEVSSGWGRLYVQMGEDEIHQVSLDLGETTDQPWNATESGITGMIATPDSILTTSHERAAVIASSGTVDSFETYSTPMVSPAVLYHPGTRKVYLDDNNELYHWTLTETGAWTPAGEAGHRTEGVFEPDYNPGFDTRLLSVSPDGGDVLLKTGHILSGDTLNLLDTLPVGVLDGCWVAGSLFTIRSEGETGTRVEAWDAEHLNPDVGLLEGTPLRIFAWNGGLVVVTRQYGQPMFHKLETDLSLSHVSEINRPPVAIHWTAPVVEESAPAGTPLGTLSTTDPNPGDTHTYSLGVNPEGILAVNGSQLSLAKDLEKRSWPDFRTFTLISTDQLGARREQSFFLPILPVDRSHETDAISHGPRYDIGEIFIDRHGVAYFEQDTGHSVLHRWSIPERRYLEPFRLLGEADLYAYEPGTHDLFVSYVNGAVTRIDLDDPSFEEKPFLKLPRWLYSMDVIDGKLVLSTHEDHFARYKVFSLDGEELASRYAGSMSWGGEHQRWDPVRRRVYTYTRSDVPANRRLLWFELNPDGSFGDAPSGFDLGRPAEPPIWIEAIGERRILMADGVFCHPDTLEPSGPSLGEEIVEAVWHDGDLYTQAVHPQTYWPPYDLTQTLLARWTLETDGSYTKTNEVTVKGEPLRIWFEGGEMWALTRVWFQPRMAELDPETLAVEYDAVVKRPSGDPQLSHNTVEEYLPAGTVVGTIHAVDPFPGIELSYDMGGNDDVPFEVVGNELRTTRPLDSFTDPEVIEVRLFVRDSLNWGFKGVTRGIHVQYVPQPPSALGLTVFPAYALDPAGTRVGTFTVEDRELPTVTHHYTLLTNPDGLFRIQGNELLLQTEAPDLPDTSHTVSVRVTSSLGTTLEKTFSVVLRALPTTTLSLAAPRLSDEDERVSFTGTVDAPHGLVNPRWWLNGVDQGPLAVENGTFQIETRLSLPGENRIQVVVEDGDGNSRMAEWAGLWTPVRTVHLGDAIEVTEGGEAVLPLWVDHPEPIRGGVIKIACPPERFDAAEWSASAALDGAFTDWNYDAAEGVVTLSFVLGGDPLPGPETLLGHLSLGVRSVPSDVQTEVWVTHVDLTDAEDARLAYGTHTLPVVVDVLRRTRVGDNNGNGRWDAGDLQQLLRFLTGASTPAAWDVTGNDLNENGGLDSGDLTLLQNQITSEGRLRAAAFDPAAPGTSGNVSFNLSRYVAAEGETFWVELRLAGTQTPAGLELRLDYPAEALRLASSADQVVGEVIPVWGDNAATVLWQGGAAHDPEQGWVRVSAASPAAWETPDGVVARFQFTVLPGAGDLDWSLRVVEAEWTDAHGSLAALPVAMAEFSTRTESNDTYADWSLREFPSLAQPVPPQESTAGDDVSNLMRYALGLGGTDPLPGDLLRPVRITDETGAAAFGLRVRLSAGDLPVQYLLETSEDLDTWDSHPLDLRRQVREPSPERGQSLFLFESELTPETSTRFMRLKVVLP